MVWCGMLDIKKNCEKILCFRKVCNMGMSKKAKVMKLGYDPEHDNAVFLWFKQKRMEDVPISGANLSEKGIQLHNKIHHEESIFSGSTGWLWRFCKCHRIRSLSLQGEKFH